jgi:CheY-like chemotaxis protein
MRMAKKAGSGLKRRTTSGSVLVVDDEADLSALIEDILEASGYQVETALDGAAALERLERDHFDLILSDVHMPGLDGMALYRELEQRRPELTPRMIFMTGNILDEDTADFFAATGAPCLRKPFMSEDLHRVLQQVLAPAQA